MTDGRSESRRSQPRTPVRATTPYRVAVVMFKGLVNILSVGLLIYLTYFFTMFFSARPLAPAPESGISREAGKKIEELRAEERQLLTTYGPVDPATKSVRIPIDRAMDLIVAEGGRPAPTPARAPPTPPSATASPKAGAATPTAITTTTAATGTQVASNVAKPATAAAVPPPPTATAPAPAPVPAPARVGMAPEQLYRAVCIACHDADGRGTIVRKAMPAIPDLTDPKWQASRTDAELLHSVLEGKGPFMLSMKDKFALAKTDPKEMVAFMRSFQPGNPGVAAVSPPAASSPAAVSPAVAAQPPAQSATAASPPAPSPSAPSAAALALRNASSSPVPILGSNPSPAPTSPSPMPTAMAPTTTLSPAPSPEKAAKLRAAGEFYGVNCIACHGQDGRGSAPIRVAMPVLPDFTTRDWQTSHDNPQLAVSIIDGKGTLMPPWRGKVSPSLASDLVAFIRGFGPAGLAVSNTSSSDFVTRFRQLQKQWQVLDQQARALARP